MTTYPVHALASARGGTLRRLATYGAIGVASTAAYVAIYAALRGLLSPAAANAIALVTTAIANTAANRRLTFDVRGCAGLARDHAAGLVALAVALLITSSSLVVLGAISPSPGRATELAVLIGANAVATVMRFLLLRFAIERPVDVPLSRPCSLATLFKSERTRG